MQRDHTRCPDTGTNVGMPESRTSSIDPPETAFVTVDGRRWRTSDPHIPANFRQELVNELMAARRAVRDATTELDTRRSRRRVNDPKLALGERGHAWWLPHNRPRPDDASTPPSERCSGAARQAGRSARATSRGWWAETWRTLLPVVRERAVKMTERGELRILRRGRVVKKHPTEGVLRYQLARTRV